MVVPLFFGVFAFAGLVLMALAALSDYRSRHVPDTITCALWGVLFLAGVMATDMFQVAVGVFFLAFFTNILWLRNRKKEFFGWGDVLILPVFVAFILQMVNPVYAVIIVAFSMLLPFFQVWYRYMIVEHKPAKASAMLAMIDMNKMRIPLVVYMAIGYAAAFCGYVFR